MDIYAICFTTVKTMEKYYIGTRQKEIYVTEDPKESGPIFSDIQEAAKYLKNSTKSIEKAFNKTVGEKVGIISFANIKDYLTENNKGENNEQQF